MPVLVHYYLNHGALLFVPIVMNRTYGLRPFKWGWVKVYGLVAVSSTLMAGINWAINLPFPSEVVANYMYMTEAPKVDNPFVFNELPWPWCVCLHGRRASFDCDQRGVSVDAAGAPRRRNALYA